LILTAAGGLAANVTAPSIIGNIEVQGPIAGIIQTTGVRTDPITGVTSAVAADWGRTIRVMTSGGTVLSSTVVQAQGGGIEGQLISRGNFLSQIIADGGISGVIAAQGDLGTRVGTARLGGILAHGSLQGEVMVLGFLAGDVEIDGGLKGGRIAAKRGIPGNLRINGSVDANSAIVSGGAIGDPAAGTALTVGQVQGIVAAEGPINLAKGTTTQAAFFQGNLLPGSPNAAAIDAIFTDGAGLLPLT
jgi:hypothetical protein